MLRGFRTPQWSRTAQESERRHTPLRGQERLSVLLVYFSTSSCLTPGAMELRMARRVYESASVAPIGRPRAYLGELEVCGRTRGRGDEASARRAAGDAWGVSEGQSSRGVARGAKKVNISRSRLRRSFQTARPFRGPIATRTGHERWSFETVRVRVLRLVVSNASTTTVGRERRLGIRPRVPYLPLRPPAS